MNQYSHLHAIRHVSHRLGGRIGCGVATPYHREMCRESKGVSLLRPGDELNDARSATVTGCSSRHYGRVHAHTARSFGRLLCAADVVALGWKTVADLYDGSEQKR